MPYEAVPRALSRLARTAREVIPIRAEREASRARMGLERAKTEFDIGQAKETTVHRERVWEAGKDVREVAGVAARRKLEELGRGEQYVTSGDFFGGLGAKDLLHIKDDLLPAIKKGAGIERIKDAQPDGPQYTKHGKPYKRWEMEQDAPLLTQIIRANTGGRQLLETWADESHKDHPWHEKANKILRENDELAIAKLNLRILHRFPPGPGTPPTVTNMYTNRVKEVNTKIARLENIASREKIAKIKAKEEKKEGTVKFKHYDKQGNPHTEYISRSQVPVAEAEVRRQGGTMEKPEKKEKPGATEFNRLRTLIDKTTKKGEREPTSDQATMINDAAQAIGYEFKKVKGPITADEKRWWWFDPETKERWTLRKKTGAVSPGQTPMGEKARVKIKQGIGREEMKEIDEVGKKVPWEKPKTERPDPLGIRRVK